MDGVHSFFSITFFTESNNVDTPYVLDICDNQPSQFPKQLILFQAVLVATSHIA